MFRKLRCWMKMCPGYVVSGWADDGVLWMGFRCDDCGKIKHAAPSYGGARISPERVAEARELDRQLDGPRYWEPRG